MPNTTIPYARNVIRRALIGIIDPEPSKSAITHLWEYFENRCAYCGDQLIRGDRRGHVDHLISRAEGGGNHISNRVLSCATCNGDEKRDRDWLEFLREKTKDEVTFRTRFNVIEDWKLSHQGHYATPIDDAVLEAEIVSALDSFNTAGGILRAERDQSN
jgi:hypothetical protein